MPMDTLVPEIVFCTRRRLSSQRRWKYSALVLLLLMTAPISAAPTPSDTLLTIKLQVESAPEHFALVPEKRVVRPTLGLALSGGGIRCVAQAGVLKALADNKIAIDYISGTSAGSIIGGLYASGYSPEEIWSIIKSLDFGNFLNDAPSRSSQFLAEKQKQSRAIIQLRLAKGKFYLPEAVTPGQKLTDTLTDLVLNAPLHDSNFSRLRVPLKIIATDLLTGQKVVLQNGNLIEAMRASVAVPLLLLPVEYDRYLLVDGGLRDNLPVEETRAFGADIVLAVDCTANLRSREDMRAPWELADQVTTIMQQAHNRDQLEKADLVLDFKDFSATSTRGENIEQMYEEGRARAEKIIPRLQALLAEKMTLLDLPPDRSYRVQKIAFLGSPRLDFSELVEASTGRSYTAADIHANLATLYDTGYYKEVAAKIIVVGQDTTLIYGLSPYPQLSHVIFHGNTIIPDSLLIKPFAAMLGRAVNRHQGRAALREVIQSYRKKGYSLADVNGLIFNEETGIANLYINEGRIGRVHFEGFATTKRYVLEREFTLKNGDLFQRQLAQTAVNNLFGTGLFDAVTLLPQASLDGWEIIVRLVEKKYTVLRWGSRYDRERNGRAFMEVAHENIFGTSNDITWHGQYGDRDQKLAVQFNANRLFKTYITSQVTVKQDYARRFQYESFIGVGEYERRTSGAHISLGTQIARLGILSGFMRLEKTRIRGLSGRGFDPGDLIVNTIGITTVVDTRDRVPFPTRGKFHTFFYEISSGRFLGADISYFKVQNQLSTYWTWHNRSTFSPRLIWGTSDLTTPFSEQFKIGGEESFYGLRDDEWQGRNMLLGSLEYRYSLPWTKYLSLFLSARFDFGAVWKNSIEVKSSDFISGRGAALTLKTPVGPLSMAFGRGSTGNKRFYFSAGYNF